MYKKLIRLRYHNLQEYNKITKLKKKKWRTYQFHFKKKNRFFKKRKSIAQFNYKVPKFMNKGNSFKYRFRNNLMAKQKFNLFYGKLLKKYLKKKMTYIYNSKKIKDFRAFCLEFFERRLDIVLYRAYFSYSIKNARQIIRHGYITVNNKTIINKSYLLKKGDIIRIKNPYVKVIQENIQRYYFKWPLPPNYLIINYTTMQIIFATIENYNFSTSFSFYLKLDLIVENFYRH